MMTNITKNYKKNNNWDIYGTLPRQSLDDFSKAQSSYICQHRQPEMHNLEGDSLLP